MRKRELTDIHSRFVNASSTFSRESVFTSAPPRYIGFYLEDKITELGGKYERAKKPLEPHVVVDGQLYTGQNPASAKPLAEKIVQGLKK